MKAWMLVGVLMLTTAVGCSFFERRTNAGPDGIVGTEDDTTSPSEAEQAAFTLKGVSDAIGLGWIGTALQGIAIVGTGIATRRKA